MTQKRCFVVMGFGEKTDLATGRTLEPLYLRVPDAERNLR